MLKVRADIKQVTRGLRDLDRKAIPTATRQGLNRAGATVKTETVRALKDELALKTQKKLRQVIRQKKATRQRARTAIIVGRSAFGLEESKHGKIRTSTRKGRRRYKVSFQGKTIANAFKIGEGKAVFVAQPDAPRYSTGNRRFKRLYSYPSLQGYKHGQIDKIQEKKGSERFRVEFDRALENQLRRLRMK